MLKRICKKSNLLEWLEWWLAWMPPGLEISSARQWKVRFALQSGQALGVSCAFSMSVGSEIAHVFGPSRHSHPGTTRRPAPRFRLTPKAGFTQDRPRIVPTPSRPSRDSLVVTQQATEAFAALDWPRKGRIRSGRLLSCAVSLRDSGVAHIRSRSSSPCDSSSQPTLKVGFAPGSRRSIARFGPPSPVRIRSWLAGTTPRKRGKFPHYGPAGVRNRWNT